MKFLTLFPVIIIALTIKTVAQTYQSFPTGSATWHTVRCFYLYQPGWHDEYTFIMDGPDTLYDGETFKKIDISVYHAPGTAYDTVYPTVFFGGLRESGKQVFMFRSWSSPDTTVKLIYDFNNENIGDTIYTNVLTGNPALFGHLVSAKDSVLVGTQYHTRLSLKDPDNSNNTELWIEGVGSSWGLPYATYWSATDNSYDLTCFFIDQQLMYGNPSPGYGYCQAPLPAINCDSVLTSAPGQVFRNTLFSLYPNPASDMVSLNIKNNDITLYFYDIVGNLIKTEKLKQDQMHVNTGDLSNGIYIVTIRSKGQTENLKLIIQR